MAAAATPAVATAATWSGPAEIASAAGAEPREAALHEDGRAMIALVRDGRVLVQERPAAGSPFGGPRRIGGRRGVLVGDVRIALDAHGAALVTWVASGPRASRSRVVAAWRSPAGRWSAPQVLALVRPDRTPLGDGREEIGGTSQAVAIDPAGGGVIVASLVAPDGRVLVRTLHRRGTRWALAGQVASGAPVDEFKGLRSIDLPLATDAAGNAAFAWGTDAGWRVAAQAGPGARWTRPERIPGDLPGPSQVVVDGADIAVAGASCVSVADAFIGRRVPGVVHLAVRRAGGWRDASVASPGFAPCGVAVGLRAGSAVAVWSHLTSAFPGSSQAIHSATWTATTAAPSTAPVAAVPPAGSAAGQIAVRLSEAGPVAAWVATGPGSRSVQAARFEGAQWTADVVPSLAAAGAPPALVLAMSPGGAALAVARAAGGRLTLAEAASP